MESFVIFAIVVAIIYVIYYTVIIVQDLYGKPKDEKSQGETFDVSNMTDEEDQRAGTIRNPSTTDPYIYRIGRQRYGHSSFRLPSCHHWYREP